MSVSVSDEYNCANVTSAQTAEDIQGWTGNLGNHQDQHGNGNIFASGRVLCVREFGNRSVDLEHLQVSTTRITPETGVTSHY